MEPKMSLLIDIIAFSIYKEWLLYGENENWQQHNIILHVKADLSVRIKIYERLQPMSYVVDFLKDTLNNFVM